jgi:hypothetical protein
VFITFLDIQGIIHFELIPQGQKVNQAYYMEILKRLREIMHGEMPELSPNDWILRHDNDPAHKALSVKKFLAQKSMTEMEHQPYSLHLASNDFWLFQEIKCALIYEYSGY